MLLRDLTAGILHGVVVADIELGRRNAGFFGEFFRRIVIAGVIRDDRKTAFVTQPFANGATDSARAPGYDGNS